MATKRLQNRIALVTGSSSGIGRAIALAFFRQGATVLCADLQESTQRPNAPSHESEAPTHQAITTAGGTARFVQIDVTSAASVEAAVQTAVREFGRLDIMVNNAGIALETAGFQAPVWDMGLDTFRKTLAVNVEGVFHGVKYASAQMIQQEPIATSLNASGAAAGGGKVRGVILNACSVVGLVANVNSSAYCTSKGAVANLTRAAALDCAPYGVRVNAVNPGYVESNLTDQVWGWGAGVREATDALHPLGGVGTPDAVADAYVFLASDDARWITGVNMPVDGGYLAR